MKTNTSYSTKLADPRWQRKRLEVFQRDNWTCQACGCTTTQLEIHHVDYWEGKEPWEYDNDMLITVCRHCHETEAIRFKHETHLLKALKYSGFMAVDILALSTMLTQQKKFTDFIRSKVREYSKM